MKRGALEVPVLAVLLLAGCDDDGDAIPAEELDDAFVASACDQIRNCPLGGLAGALNQLVTEANTSCESLFDDDIVEDFGDLQAGIDEGRVGYDGVAARKCIDQLTAQCNFVDEGHTPAECVHVFEGTRAPGESCTLDEECTDGFCERMQSGCPGTCRAATVVLGGDCEIDRACIQNDSGNAIVCATTGGASICVEDVMAAASLAGETCGQSISGNTRTNRICGEGLWCDTPAGSETGVCRNPIPAGDACEAGQVCAGDAICLPNTLLSWVCRSLTIVNTAGQHCNEAEFTICNSALRLRCEDEVCVVAGDGTAGSYCEGDDALDFPCNDGLVCDTDNNECGAPKANGEPCSSDDECVSDFCIFRLLQGGSVCEDAPMCM